VNKQDPESFSQGITKAVTFISSENKTNTEARQIGMSKNNVLRKLSSEILGLEDSVEKKRQILNKKLGAIPENKVIVDGGLTSSH
jgi:hypothetical protein